MLIRNHQFHIVLGVKSESGHCQKFFCLLQSLKFPQICHQNLLWKLFQYSSISYSQPICSQGLDCFSTNFPGLRHLIVLLIFITHRTHDFCVCVIILVTCWSQKMIFSPCFSKTRMPFIFPCDTVFSVYGLLSKSESLQMEEANLLAYPWKRAPRDSARTFNTDIKTAPPYDSFWAL